MTAIAAIVNKAVEDDKVIIVFYNTSKAQLGLCLESGTSDDDQPSGRWETGDGDYNGCILNPSQMAAVNYRGLQFVAAVTMPKVGPNETQTSNQISLVSPVYQQLTTTALDHVCIAMCANSDGDQGWLYYYDGTDPTERTLMEFSLRTGKSATYSSANVVKPSSSLAAWYDSDKKQRHVIFEGSGLSEFIVEENAYSVFAASYRPNTPIAAVYSKHTKKAYVYYVDDSLSIQRIVKRESGWGNPEALRGPSKVAEACQLTVVNANDYNHLFYIAKDSSNNVGGASYDPFEHWRDPVDD
ncbi:hypothetical protein F5Y07DRAFT_362790 [Xylaria sp. FL0933]|nr:hypothetical protein F5Y07DRAFT_362790 [Xylaria sp. FL0933]